MVRWTGLAVWTMLAACGGTSSMDALEETGQSPVFETCGDGTCADGEDCLSCSLDCGICPPSCAGDGVCDASAGETCESCPADCRTTAAVCGNGACDGGETPASCSPDCGPPAWPEDWDAIEAQVVEAFNAERAAGSRCPSGNKPVSGPLAMDTTLQKAARLHSWDQAYSGYFDHPSCNGRSPWDRAAAVGASAFGENVAWGYVDARDVTAGWMSSTSGHCDAIMEPGYTHVGIGFVELNGDLLWTAMFR